MTPARTAAYRVLRAVFGGDDLPNALARVRDTLGDDRDRALVTEITTGTLRWLGALDRVIEQVAARSTDRLDEEVLTVLRLGAYQLLYLERVPAAAAVHESVDLVRRMGKT
ncbi:MAG TPA: transcription antitermination protein NusB, partial [Acidobacteria bacterium]|nr:transcription antitermination protein NusB [Acidobacteriota bacterium]